MLTRFPDGSDVDQGQGLWLRSHPRMSVVTKRFSESALRRAAGSLLALALLGAGCDRSAKTPEAALTQIERVVASGDGLLAWKIVDSQTRSAAEAVLEDQRLMQTIVKAKYPAAEAARELEKLAAADEPDAAHFFARTCKTWGLIEGLRKRLGSVSGVVKTQADAPGSLWVARADGMAFHLAKVGGGWAWVDLRGEWQMEKDRAAHAVKTVRDNAALYKKAEGQ